MAEASLDDVEGTGHDENAAPAGPSPRRTAARLAADAAAVRAAQAAAPAGAAAQAAAANAALGENHTAASWQEAAPREAGTADTAGFNR
jgi:hypothetical protein